MLVNNTFHVTYCTNIHPGSNWKQTFQSLKDNLPEIKKNVVNKEAFGLGLRLSNKASEELNNADNLAVFKSWLADNNIYVFTMNGFPYGNFHDEPVKDLVHAPDWTTAERMRYTKRLFEQLEELLPENMSGGISTSPISYKHWFKTDDAKETAFKKGAISLMTIVKQLSQIEKRSGKYLHLDIEPEPDGLIENSDEFILFFESYLIPLGVDILKNDLALTSIEAESLIKRHITICYDVCHFSLAYEEPEDTFRKLETSGITIGKIQVSAALKIIFEEENKENIWKALSVFNEPTYLHQVTQKVGGVVKTYNDLPIVLAQKKDFKELRAHFHVPIFLEQFGLLHSTQDHILKVISVLKKNAISEHLEIETYTWDVLPQSLKKDLSESIVREINWLNQRLKNNE